MSGIQGAPYVRLKSSKPRAGVWMPGTALLLLLPAAPRGHLERDPTAQGTGHRGKQTSWIEAGPVAPVGSLSCPGISRIGHLDPFLCQPGLLAWSRKALGGWGVAGGERAWSTERRRGGRSLARRLGRPWGVQEQRTRNALRLRSTQLLSDHLHLRHPSSRQRESVESVSSQLPFPSEEIQMQPPLRT